MAGSPLNDLSASSRATGWSINPWEENLTTFRAHAPIRDKVNDARAVGAGAACQLRRRACAFDTEVGEAIAAHVT